MSKYFVYQPHIHESDAVITPDIVIENLAATTESGDEPAFQPIPLSPISSIYEIQLNEADWVVRVAYLLVASGNGTILAPGLDILPADADDGSSIAAGEKSIGRQAWRLPDLASHFAELTVRLSAFSGSETIFSKETVAASMGGPDGLVSAYCRGREELPRAAAVIDIPGTMRPGDLPRGAAIMGRAPEAYRLENGVDRVVVEFEDSKAGRAVDHVVTFDRLD